MASIKATTGDEKTTEQVYVVIADRNLSTKDLISVIPAHCFKRSALISSLYVIWNLLAIVVIYQTTAYLDAFAAAKCLALPSPTFCRLLRFTIWSFYAFASSLPMVGLWGQAHECGHQAFSESNMINNVVGWLIHSSLSVPYHSWRISHSKHHAATSHLTEDQLWVPRTRSQLGLPTFDPSAETLSGSSVSKQVMDELWEAIGDTPMITAVNVVSYLLFGWPMYAIINASGQMRYPTWTNHFNPYALIYKPHHYRQIVVSDIGVFLWLACIIVAVNKWNFADVFRVYLAPYLWLNHWIVMITFLQHTDPTIPHYRQSEFTFQRGALSTLDRGFLGDPGSLMGYIGACVTHGMTETHVLHHISNKIPHYHAWEASDALRRRLAQAGINLRGRPVRWSEMYRVFKECRFVEDEGDIVFYKNAYGQAAAQPLFLERGASHHREKSD